MTPQLVVVAPQDELPSGRIWGTGGWQMPAERRALDWYTLARLLGWDVAAKSAVDIGHLAAPALPSVIVFTSSSDLVDPAVQGWLERLARDRPPLLICPPNDPRASPGAIRVGPADRSVNGTALEWLGPGRPAAWVLDQPIELAPLAMEPDAELWATLEGAPIVGARRAEGATVVTIAGDASALRDAGGGGTSLLRRILVDGPAPPVAWLDFTGTLVLRMDDPGSAENVHHRDRAYAELDAPFWSAAIRQLRARDARVSVGYVSGWVDDGDPSRGELEVGGAAVERVPGRVHPSPDVRYRDRAGHLPGVVHDYRGEAQAIRDLIAAGVGDVEIHGYTHMYPDAAAWAQAPDRYETPAWYREMGRFAAAALARIRTADHPLALAAAALQRHFSTSASTVIFPGEEWTDDALERALNLGIQLIGSYYLAMRDGDRFCWAQHVCSPYLDLAGPEWFTSGLPVVGYFHDYDPAIRGIEWLIHWLDRWQAAGASRLIDYRELAAALGRRVAVAIGDDGRPILRVRSAPGAPALVRPLPIALSRWPCDARQVSVDLDGSVMVLTVDFGGEVPIVRVPMDLALLPSRA